MTSPNLISSRILAPALISATVLTFTVCCLVGLGLGYLAIPGFFWGKMGYLGWMGFLGEMRQTRCGVSDDGTRRSFFLFDNDLNLMGRKYKHSY